MKTLVTYSSQTGNTLKLAKTIYDELKGEKEIFPMDQVPSTIDYDLVAVGFWLQAGKPDPKAMAYLSKFTQSSRLFLFATHGAATDSDHVKHAVDYAVGLTNNAQIAGVFTCQGEVNPKVLEKVKQKPEPPVWIKDADTAIGHPNELDIQDLINTIRGL
ncbi:MAG: flavodoxin family protein [Deltaproteobacteria bacterium]|nr:MAG: flavodoxin family protein [Deltaproteobacteria bacterium]